MLVVKILFILLFPILLISGFVTGLWFLSNNIWITIFVPVALIVLYFVFRKLVSILKYNKLQDLLDTETQVLNIKDFSFRDLNKNGKLDVYEDSRQPIAGRVEDLLNQMTIEEKVGLMFSPMIGAARGGKIQEKSSIFSKFGTTEIIAKKKINTITTFTSGSPSKFTKWYNGLQKIAERTRLGIPITLCSDPRHEFVESDNPLANLLDSSVSKWPTPLGLAATRDVSLVESFGNIAKQELRALGIRFALHPMADLATEPRWSRIYGTFGEDATLAENMIQAYIRGFQGENISSESVACCVKHFPGGGPQKEGLDAHLSYGKEQIYPGKNFDYHLRPFINAIKENVASIMPYYGVPINYENYEEVGFNFNKQIVTDLLRNKLGFNGIVHTDYAIITALKLFGVKIHGPISWGVEKLSRLERVEKAVNAGIDQLGGETCNDLLMKLVTQGRITEERIDDSCRRVLKLKFELGLFENPYVDEETALDMCNKDEFAKAGREAMQKSIVLLKNKTTDGTPILPLMKNLKVYIEGFSKAEVEKYAVVVKKPEDADFALLRISAPYRRDFRELFGLLFRGGDLSFKQKQRRHLEKIMDACPTIVDIFLDRPAVIPELETKAAAILGNFGAFQEIILECIFGEFEPTGKLPFELPRSMDAVKTQKTDLPYDSENPLYSFGHGLTYE